MREEAIQYFSSFLSEFQEETDRVAALVGAALIDDRMERLLKSHLLECKQSKEILNGGSSPLGSFSARTNMAYCLGLITELEYKEIETQLKARILEKFDPDAIDEAVTISVKRRWLLKRAMKVTNTRWDIEPRFDPNKGITDQYLAGTGTAEIPR